MTVTATSRYGDVTPDRVALILNHKSSSRHKDMFQLTKTFNQNFGFSYIFDRNKIVPQLLININLRSQSCKIS